jgi:N-acetylneuraminic acid mutarotase
LTANWRHVPLIGDVPKARAYHSATVVDDKIYIFGGMINEGTYSTYFDDMHVIDPGKKTRLF